MPQDPWNIAKVKADKAIKRLPTDAAGKVDWGDIRVAHLDTGYTRHPAFGTWTPAGINPVVLAKKGRDFFDNRPDPLDPLTQVPLQDPGHGTRTGSALAAVDAGNIRSLAPGLPLVPYRVNDNSLIGGRAARAIGEAIPDAIKRNDCRIVSISLGFPVVNDHAMGEGVDFAYDRGVIVIGAAGQEINKVCYPGKHRRAIAVAGVTRANRIYYPYESYARIDVWAPADHIWRANVPPESYGEGEGTSYAVPHVTAAAAMWLRLRGPEIDAAYSEPWQRVEAFRVLLRSSGITLPFKPPPDNRGKLLEIDRLIRATLPKASFLTRELDQAADDAV